jgi:hypothetical protein
MERNKMSKSGFAKAIGSPVSTCNKLISGESGSGSFACMPALQYLEEHDSGYVSISARRAIK